MGRISLGDVAFGGLLTLLLAGVITFVVGVVMSAGFSSSRDDLFTGEIIALPLVFLGGGVVLAIVARRAGYPVLATWALGSGIILLVYIVMVLIGTLSSGVTLTTDLFVAIATVILTVLLGLFFAVSLAAYLNSRAVGMAQRKTFGSVPGQFGAYIYRSNQPVIYEGIRELDLADEAPGTLYRRKQ